MSEKKLLKQDINFLEYPIWFQTNQVDLLVDEGFCWKDKNGYVYRAGYKVPGRMDQIFLLSMLHISQREGWKKVIKLSRYKLLKECGCNTSKPEFYLRLEDSLRRWTMVTMEFQGTFYDGNTYRSINFGIIDAWKIDEHTKELTVYFSPFWLTHIRNSTFFKLLDFDQLKQLRSPLVLRLHELLVKTFQSRRTWQIDALKLAEKIPMKEKHPAHIIPKIEAGVRRICKKTELRVDLEVKKPKRGEALFIFRKRLQEGEVVEEDLVEEVVVESGEDKEAWSDLMEFLPEREREKKTIARCVELAWKEKGFEYVKQNILYANENAKKSYRTYLSKALKEDWGGSWWEEQKALKEEEIAQKSEQDDFVREFEKEQRKELERYKERFIELRSEEEYELVCTHVEARVESQNLSPQAHSDLVRSHLLGLLKSGVKQFEKES